MSEIARLKVTLDRLKPQVLRRIEVPVGISLEGLHLVIQIAMGWENCHLYAFRTRESQWSCTDPHFGDPRALPAEETSLAELLREGGAKAFRYHYDFGDDWEHTVKVEAVTDADPDTLYPRLLEARRACPPEDCGGPWGYAGFLASIADPAHERHAQMREWLGEDFDPAVVDEAAIRKSLKALASRPRRRASSAAKRAG